MTIEYHVRPGGLMRCCLATLEEIMEAATEPVSEGATLRCEYEKDKSCAPQMIFRDGAWEWNQNP